MKPEVKSNGKLSIKGAKTIKSEENILRNRAIKSKVKNDKFENENEYVKVPIKKGFRMVLKEKYLKNKEYYDSLIG